LILLATLIIVGVYIFFHPSVQISSTGTTSSINSQLNIRSSTTNTIVAFPSSIAIATNTIGWLTYTNSNYGYQLEYPPGATSSIVAINASDPRAVRFQLEDALGLGTVRSFDANENGPSMLFFLITAQPLNPSSTLVSWFNQETTPENGNNMNLISQKSFSVGGEPAIWAQFEGGGLQTEDYSLVLIFSIHNNIGYRVAGVRLPDPSHRSRMEDPITTADILRYQPLFDAMVSSIKFIDAQSIP